MLRKRSALVYATLAAAWLLTAAWQVVEHNRVKASASSALLDRAHDISNSLGVVMRSQRRFGIIPQTRIQAALEELTKISELDSVALLNASGDVTVSAGNLAAIDLAYLTEHGARWEQDSVTVLNLVDLGVDGEPGGSSGASVPIVLPPQEGDGPGRPFGRGPNGRQPQFRGPGPRPEGEGPPPRPDGPRPSGPDRGFEGRGRSRDRGPGREPRGEGRGEGFRRPPYMNEERYNALVEKQGVRYFVLSMATDAYHVEAARDFWLRTGISGIALIAVLGLGLATSTFNRTNALQMRLLRAGEMNTHLRELNIAAAGLAHETRNPLNIIRGQAHLLAKGGDASPGVRAKSEAIVEEVDRVTGRLNQFIDYARPTEPRPAPIDLCAVARDVARTLQGDLEDKEISFGVAGPELVVEADESLLRQVLFNLMLNAISAVPNGGKISFITEKNSRAEASFALLDDGNGVAEEDIDQIFKPYFTTSETGTGLGLAVVRQIVLAHHWEIGYIPGDNGGARLRVTGLQLA